jgi:MoaA/NifB/PqqE/SkfB family radical SAM enzyme
MQNKNIHEILWEFTLDCNKHCKYCGSKKWMKSTKTITDKHRLDIAEQIALLKPKNVDFTGGEPSVKLNNLIDCIKMIADKSPDTNIKILTNGYLFDEKNWNIFSNGVKENTTDSLMCAYGLSINENEDFIVAGNILANHNNILNKITMITNFGKHNLELFDKLEKTAHLFGAWQVQLTIDENLQLDEDDIVILLNKLKEAQINNENIVIADNLNDGKCTAGINSCGITYDGDVVPCLSMRSWSTDMKSQGNILFDETNLIKIWENKFTQYRNRKLSQLCCKDITRISDVIKNNFIIDDSSIINELMKTPGNKIKTGNMIIYGVQPSIPKFPDDTQVFTYGVIKI